MLSVVIPTLYHNKMVRDIMLTHNLPLCRHTTVKSSRERKGVFKRGEAPLFNPSPSLIKGGGLRGRVSLLIIWWRTVEEMRGKNTGLFTPSCLQRY